MGEIVRLSDADAQGEEAKKLDDGRIRRKGSLPVEWRRAVSHSKIPKNRF